MILWRYKKRDYLGNRDGAVGGILHIAGMFYLFEMKIFLDEISKI